MKSIATLLLLIFSFCLMAQVPQAISYQAVARDGSGAVMANASINIEFKIHDGAPGGNIVFSEQHLAVSTNQFGLFSLAIGNGTAGIGSFGTIDWANGDKYVEVLVNGSPISTTQLLSVPYALHAGTADNVDDADANPTNEIQTLSVTNDLLTISQGNTVAFPKELPVGALNQTLRNNGTNWVASGILTDNDSMLRVNGAFALSQGFYLAYFTTNSYSYANVESYVSVYPNSTPATRALSFQDGQKQGQILVVTIDPYVTSGNGVRITSGGNLRLNGGGSLDLLIDDTLTIIWNGVRWVELSRSNN